MRALIDADILVYRCGFAAEPANYHIYLAGKYDEPVHIEHLKKDADAWVAAHPQEEYSLKREIDLQPLSHALHLVNNNIKTALEITRSDSYQCYLSGSTNYRNDVATIMKYKDRPDRKPSHYKEIREFLIKRWGAVIVDGYEADDAVAMEQWQSREYDETVICSRDKDLLMIPGYHYNFEYQVLHEITEEAALRQFFKQMLTGDPTDTIPGLYKLTGEKCKKDYLEELDRYDDPEILEEQVYRRYVQATSGCKDLTAFCLNTALPEIARLLWMSREKPDDCPFFQS